MKDIKIEREEWRGKEFFVYYIVNWNIFPEPDVWWGVSLRSDAKTSDLKDLEDIFPDIPKKWKENLEDLFDMELQDFYLDLL